MMFFEKVLNIPKKLFYKKQNFSVKFSINVFKFVDENITKIIQIALVHVEKVIHLYLIFGGKEITEI